MGKLALQDGLWRARALKARLRRECDDERGRYTVALRRHDSYKMFDIEDAMRVHGAEMGRYAGLARLDALRARYDVLERLRWRAVQLVWALESRLEGCDDGR